jgi:hypothetical protein
VEKKEKKRKEKEKEKEMKLIRCTSRVSMRQFRLVSPQGSIADDPSGTSSMC